MQVTFTEDDLIRFIYQETTTAENAGILAELSFNQELNATYQDLLLSMDMLKQMEMEPEETSIRLIMEYSVQHSPMNEGLRI